MTQHNYALKKMHRALRRAREWSNVVGKEASKVRAKIIDAEMMAKELRFKPRGK